MYKYLIVKVSKQYSATNCPELHDLNIRTINFNNVEIYLVLTY